MGAALMDKRYFLIEKVIDFLALFLVLYHFLRFVNVIPSTIQPIVFLDNFIILILAADFIYRYRHAENSKQFLKDTWIELFSLIPFSGFFKAFRIFRIIKKSKFSSFFKFAHQLLSVSGLYYAIGVVLLLSFIGGGILFKIEESIPTFTDGIWFAFVTMTTVGYGDLVPVSDTGRWISVFLMIVGIGFISVLSGGIASFLVNQRRKSNRKDRTQVDLSEFSTDERKEILNFIDYVKHRKK